MEGHTNTTTEGKTLLSGGVAHWSDNQIHHHRPHRQTSDIGGKKMDNKITDEVWDLVKSGFLVFIAGAVFYVTIYGLTALKTLVAAVP